MSVVSRSENVPNTMEIRKCCSDLCSLLEMVTRCTTSRYMAFFDHLVITHSVCGHYASSIAKYILLIFV